MTAPHPAPGRQIYAQHWVATVDLMYLDVDNPNTQPAQPYINTDAFWGADWNSRGATQVLTVMATYPRFTGSSNQPPQFVTGQFSTNTNVSTVYTCIIGQKCTVPLYINDFVMHSDGTVDNPLVPSGDSVGVEMAVGFPTVSGALGDDSVSCVRAAVSSAAATTLGALYCPYRLGASTAPFFGDADIGQVRGAQHV